jgi:hypothetical protein
MTSDELRAYAPQAGVVIDIADPKKLGRIRASIPGYIDETGWAMPVGMGGETRLGTFNPPPIGADVIISFISGDPHQPIYMNGPWGYDRTGKSGVPTAAKEALDEDLDAADKIYVVETPKFEVVHDSRLGRVRMYLRAKSAGQNMNGPAIMIELDETNGTVGISAPVAITLRSFGAIGLEANEITLNGRKVSSSPKDL